MHDIATVETQLALIPRENILSIWPQVEAMLLPAIERSDGRWDKWAVITGLVNAQMELWIAHRDGKPEAAMIGRIQEFPCMRVYALPWLGGKYMRHWMHFEPAVVEYARSRGCKELEGYGRKGFQRVVPHWKFSWTFMRRPI